MSRGQDALEAALAEHHAAVEDYVARASRIPPEDWHRPVAAGKWSPGEITEHLRLAMEKLDLELRGESEMKAVLPPWKRLLLRRTVLPRMLRTGRFPKGVRAPREIRPLTQGPVRDEALRGLSETAARFEASSAAAASPTRRLTHPYFGGLPLARFHRLLALHTRHHREQLPTESK
jgi:hypothetical protein